MAWIWRRAVEEVVYVVQGQAVVSDSVGWLSELCMQGRANNIAIHGYM